MVDGNAGPITGDETVISEVVSNNFVGKLLNTYIILLLDDCMLCIKLPSLYILL